MARYLFVFPPFVGHVMPAAGVAGELTRRGHEVAWVVHASAVGHLLVGNGDGPGDTVVHDVGDEHLVQLGELLPEHDRLRGPASLQFLWERVLVPLTEAMRAPVHDAVDSFRPDVVLSDQQAFAGALVAHDRELPWAVSASSTAELVDPLAAVPKIGAWVQDRLAELDADGVDPRFSPYLTLQYSTEAFVGTPGRDASAVAFVGPVVHEPDGPLDPEWQDWLARHDRHILVSLGTVTQDKGRRFLAAALDGLADAPYGTVLVGPDDLVAEVEDAGGAGGVGPGRGNVVVRPHVPQVALLPWLDAVVSHAGYNTVAEALWHGVPLVCAPIREDQPHNAGNVVRVGAGRRLSFARAGPVEIREAVDDVVDNPEYRHVAAQVQASFRSAGGAPRAATLLEHLAAADRAPDRSVHWISPRGGRSSAQNGGSGG